MNPTLGLDILFQSADGPRAAKVTRVIDSTTVNLVVFADGEDLGAPELGVLVSHHAGVLYQSSGEDAGTWRFAA